MSTTLYVLQNQQGHFLQKANTDKTNKTAYTWGDGTELNKVFRTTHKDEAINMMFESGSQNVELRISILTYPSNPKGLPIIPTDDMPTPIPVFIAPNTDENPDSNVEIAATESTHHTDAT
ncbi:hypothetical protein ACVBE9_10470 [Eionea flava]